MISLRASAVVATAALLALSLPAGRGDARPADATTVVAQQQPPPRQPPPPPQPPPPSVRPPSPAVSEPTSELPADPAGSSGVAVWVPWAIAAVAVFAAAALLALLIARRSRTTDDDEDAEELPPAPPPPADTRMQELLEVSRRLTAAMMSGEIERAVVREAIGLVGATGAALVRRVGHELVVAHESQAELLRPEGLKGGLVDRVAQTGQPVLEVSATEPSVRYLPAAIAAVPLVSDGRVGGVLVLMRGQGRMFTTLERDRLMALAPIATAVMQTAREADEKSTADALTGIGNRRRLDADLSRVLAAAHGRSTAVIMVDLDHFKAINDTFGHQAGDTVLRTVAGVLRATIRPTDSAYRYGGEEFCVVLPDADVVNATQVAERIRVAIAERRFDVGTDTGHAATASLGVAAATRGTPEELVRRADAALYQAKASGRDRVVSAG